MQKFILLGRPRTGTTVFKELLNKMPNVYCGNELFNKRVIDKEASESPIFYMRNWYEQIDANYHTVGFKLHYDHAQKGNEIKIWDHIISQPKIKIIQLRRKNFLNTVVSFEKAMITKEWQGFSQDDNEKRQLKLKLPYKKCLNRFKEFSRLDETYFDVFNKHPIMVVYYEELLKNFDKVISNVQYFLNISQRKISNICKIKTTKLSEEISNYHNLKQRFKNTKWSVFFEE